MTIALGFLQIYWLDYSSSIPVIVIVIVALAEELLAAVWLVVSLLSEMLVSGGEALVSDTADADDTANTITKAIRRIRPFTFTTS